ncbi:Hypothetical protein PHPALM_16797 [Phytophthora palmivora]|uniref:Uncharacterized protein n=1 Tax=Phytophthora palmivora TaxID=4796 RepID=A0A2P4XNX2_9STRA|nr:Hypothetical protein PHPALM_16797 [Phytophthora palmivora]
MFEGDINGVKLNSFLFQFESYFTFKGYYRVADDAVVGRKLGYSMTANTWSAMKVSMEKNFKEPNLAELEE